AAVPGFFVEPKKSGASGALALALGEQLLAQANAFRRDFHQLVVFDEVQGLFQRHADRRRQDDVLIAAGGANVGQLLGLGRVDDQVVVARVNADQLAFVYLHVRVDKQAAAFLQGEQGVGQDLAGDIGDQYT